MRRALRLAERGVGEANPNPAVGCVLVRGGVVVGEGFHERAGSAHAEAVALERAGDRARGSTAFVTLEPCAPHPEKRTPPCAPRLIEAGVSRVVVGVRDQNPRVRGAGIRRLRAAGIEVSEGVCVRDARRLAQHFNQAMKTERPFVALKAGMTLDGRIATSSGESKWITSTAQRRAARALRRLFDGVVVGVGTALSDDPRLLPSPFTERPYFRILLDSSLRLPLHSRLVKSARRSPLLVLCLGTSPRRRRALEREGVVVIAVQEESGRVSIQAALQAMWARGITSLLVEGGAEVLGAFVRAGAFDEMVIFRAPLILGGRESLGAVGGENPKSLVEAVPMRRSSRNDSATWRYGLNNAADLEVEVFERRPQRSSIVRRSS